MRIILYISILTCIISCNSNRQENKKSNIDKTLTDSSIKTPVDNLQKEIDSFPFDTILDNCLNAPNGVGQTTMGMVDCYDNASIKFDTILMKLYKELYTKLDKQDKQKLKVSQENWRKFYKAESDFLYSAFYTWANSSKYGHGREHSITQAEWKYNVMRQRLINLMKYNEEISVDEK
jgi:uncharacterized protein YecT (DUF1311 family)